jgi:hypothetical protein
MTVFNPRELPIHSSASLCLAERPGTGRRNEKCREKSMTQTRSRPGSQKTDILWNPQVHCRVRKRPPVGPALSQINPLQILTLCTSNVDNLILVSPPRTGFSSCPSLFSFSINIFYACLFSAASAIWPTCPLLAHANTVKSKGMWRIR